MNRFLKMLFNQRGEVAIGADPAGGGNNGGGAAAPTWHESIPADVTYETGGKAIPLREHEAIKGIKDLPTLAKSYLDAQSEIGRRVRMPDKDAKPEDRAAFTKKLSEGGFLPVVPEKPEAYQIAKPEKLPAGVELPDEAIKGFTAVAHKLGLTNDQANAIVAYEIERIGGMVAPQLAAAEAQQKAAEEQVKANLEGLKKQWGADYAKNEELAARAGKHIFGTAEEAAKHSGNSDPKWINALLTVGKMMEGGDGFPPAGSTTSPAMMAAQQQVANLTGASLSQADRAKLPYWDRSHPEHDKTVAEVYDLNKQVHPGRVTE